MTGGRGSWPVLCPNNSQATGYHRPEMPGGGSLVAANYVLRCRQADGLTTVMPNSNVYLEQLSGHKEVRFDLRKFPNHRVSGKKLHASST